MIVKTELSSVSDGGTWALYHACVWAQYSDGQEYRISIPIHIPVEAPEANGSYAAHEHICQRVIADQFFPSL